MVNNLFIVGCRIYDIDRFGYSIMVSCTSLDSINAII